MSFFFVGMLYCCCFDFMRDDEVRQQLLFLSHVRPHRISSCRTKKMRIRISQEVSWKRGRAKIACRDVHSDQWCLTALNWCSHEFYTITKSTEDSKMKSRSKVDNDATMEKQLQSQDTMTNTSHSPIPRLFSKHTTFQWVQKLYLSTTLNAYGLVLTRNLDLSRLCKQKVGAWLVAMYGGVARWAGSWMTTMNATLLSHWRTSPCSGADFRWKIQRHFVRW